MNPNHNDLIFKFAEHLKVLNRTSDTISGYIKYVKRFLEAFQSNDIKGIGRSDIETYIASLYDYRYTKGDKTGGYTAASISIQIRAIKRFFEFLEFSNVVFINPAEYIKEPKKERRLPKDILTTEEARKILDMPNLGTYLGIRDRAMLELFYSTGLRIRELCKLTIFDADLQGGLLRINKGKGIKDRVVPLGKHAVRFLREYITKVRPRMTKKNRSSRYLFVSYSSKPLDVCAVGVIIRKYAKTSGIKKQVSAHTFRHTFATQLIRNGADIRAVQKMMGHSRLSTTQEYIRLAGTNLKKDHRKSHPREQDIKSSEVIKPSIERKVSKHEQI